MPPKKVAKASDSAAAKPAKAPKVAAAGDKVTKTGGGKVPSKKAATKAPAAKTTKAAAPAAAPTKKAAAAPTKAPTKAPAKASAKAPTKAPANAKKVPAAKKAAPAKATDAKAKDPAPVKAAAARKSALPSRKKSGDESDKENEQLPKDAAADAAKTASKRKRDAEDDAGRDDDHEEEAPRPIKKAKAVSARPGKAKKILNEAPTDILEVFVFGEGSSGELGLGSVKVDGKKPIDVKRPRLNANLKNIVQIACGGMHVAALTNDNKILTWGVNDQGALGRDTTWGGGLKDMDDDDDSEDEDDSGLNPRESTPAEINTENVPHDVVWAQVAASDSATFALDSKGDVYGWGTFRSNDGLLGFSKEGTLVQKTAVFIPLLKNIVQLSAGSNHVLARDTKGKVYAWGSGQQCQLGRKPLERDARDSLVPSGVGSLPQRSKASQVVCGSYHSFALNDKGRVIGWGLNNYAELGLPDEAGSDGGNILKPALVDSLAEYNIVQIAGGEHHSLARTDDGRLLTWGRIDGFQVGLAKDVFNEENTIYDEHSKPRILKLPTVVPNLPPIVHVAAGTDHSFAVADNGRVYSWGFSANYQTGQGTTDDIEVPTLIDNSAIRDKTITWAGAGGQYSVLAAKQE